MQVSIIIINYNTFNLTSQCIRSVYQYTKEIEYEIILVDNASSERNAEDLLIEFPQIKLVKSGLNLGFARGNNLGISYATGEYILLLNSDTILIENSINILYHRAIKDKKIGAMTSKLIYPDGRNQYPHDSFPSIMKILFEMFRIQKIFKEKGSRFLMGVFYNEDKEIEVDWIWGTVFFFNKSILKSFPNNKLHETYFMYWEDMEWCYHLKKSNYKILYYPETKIIHIGGSSNANKKNEMIYNNKKDLIIKNNSKLYYLLYYLLYRILLLSNFKLTP